MDRRLFPQVFAGSNSDQWSQILMVSLYKFEPYNVVKSSAALKAMAGVAKSSFLKKAWSGAVNWAE